MLKTVPPTTLAIAAKNRPDMSPTHHDSPTPTYRPGVEKERDRKSGGRGADGRNPPTPVDPTWREKKATSCRNLEGQVRSSALKLLSFSSVGQDEGVPACVRTLHRVPPS